MAYITSAANIGIIAILVHDNFYCHWLRQSTVMQEILWKFSVSIVEFEPRDSNEAKGTISHGPFYIFNKT